MDTKVVVDTTFKSVMCSVQEAGESICLLQVCEVQHGDDMVRVQFITHGDNDGLKG